MTDSPDDVETVPIEIELTRPVVEQVVAAATLVGVSPSEFVENGILTRLEAFDRVLFDETEYIELPADFESAEWRRRHERIREPEIFEP